jgi:hypothetical protein
MDLVEELAKLGDEILHELTIIETKNGELYVILPDDIDLADPERIDKIGYLFSQLLSNWVLRLKDSVTCLHDKVKKEDDRRIIPVQLMPKSIKL